MITDGGNNIQFDWKVIAILKLDNYTRIYFSNKNTQDIKTGNYKMIILFNHVETLILYAYNHRKLIFCLSFYNSKPLVYELPYVSKVRKYSYGNIL